jgi:hypothetical protein
VNVSSARTEIVDGITPRSHLQPIYHLPRQRELG